LARECWLAAARSDPLLLGDPNDGDTKIYVKIYPLQ